MRSTLAAMMMLVISGAAAGVAQAQVSLRGQSDPVAGEVSKVSPAGITMVVGGVEKTASWDRVREVHGEHGAEAAKQLDFFKNLWRARMRLERGDYVAAEPTFESLAPTQYAATGPTQAVIFEGLARCRLKRGATLPAIWSWLDWVHARGGDIGTSSKPAAVWVGGRLDAAPIVEAKSGLMISTPPVFVHDAALDAAVGSDEWSRFAAMDSTTADLAMLYRAAARFEADLPPDLEPTSSTSDTVKLVGEFVTARVGDDKQRETARASLKARLEQRDLEPWLECWCRLAIGRSLVREKDPDVVRQGIIQLLHVPSRFARVSGYAAANTLAEAAVLLHDLGDDQGAAALKGEMLDRYPRSQAAGWSRLREIKMTPQTQRAAAPEAAPASKDAPADATGKQGRGA